MKKCSWCGKEHSNDATVCLIDEQPLVWVDAPESPQNDPQSNVSTLAESTSSTAEVEFAAFCSKCGYENPEGLQECPACGTPLLISPALPQAKAKKKSVELAVFLTLAFGPLGLLYSSINGVITMFPIGLILLFVTRGGYQVVIGTRIICAIWAYYAIREHNLDEESDEAGYALLSQATRLETQGRTQEAVALYEKIAAKYSDMPSGQDSRKSLESLRHKID